MDTGLRRRSQFLFQRIQRDGRPQLALYRIHLEVMHFFQMFERINPFNYHPEALLVAFHHVKQRIHDQIRCRTRENIPHQFRIDFHIAQQTIVERLEVYLT